jgi:phage-related protein
MGVLFQREELFKAASNLRGFGEQADKLTDRIRVLSKGVALGYTNFDELSQIVGRTAQVGRLTAREYDMLAYRGIILDKSLRGAKVTAEELYEALDNALPDEILKDRANTIQGRMIRLQTAFRDVGMQILGVDKETSRFIEGGLGDRMVKSIEGVTSALRSVAPMVQRITNALISLTDWISRNRIVMAIFAGAVLGVLVPAFTIWAASATASAAATLASLAPLLLVGAAVGALAYLVISNWDKIRSTTAKVWNAITGFIGEKITWLRENWLSAIGFIIGAVATLPIKLPILAGKAIIGMVRAITSVDWGKVWSGLTNAASRAWDNIRALGSRVFNFFKGLRWGDIFKGAAKGIANGIISLLEGAINGALSGIPGVPDIKIPRFEKGVRNFGGGLAVVGERGPELVSLPRGSNVHTAQETSRMLSAPTINVYNEIHNEVDYRNFLSDLGWRLRTT